MGDKSGIEWTDATWNPVIGCKAVSPGCDNCYAAREASGRLRGLPIYAGLAENGKFTGEIRTLESRLDQPLRWKKPRRIFVNSMSDLFHPDVPNGFRERVWEVMAVASQHTFQILTKRPQEMERWVNDYYGTDTLRFLSNVWLGTSIENNRYVFRADYLRDTAAEVRFLSIEPLLGPLPDINLDGIDWVIVGGESGPKARPMNVEWVRPIRDRCIAEGVAFHFKQWGEWCPDFAYPGGKQSGESMTRLGKHNAGRELDGRTWDEYPTLNPSCELVQ